MLQDPKTKKMAGVLAALVVLMVISQVVFNRPPAPDTTPKPTPMPLLDPPVKRGGYTIARIINNNDKAIYHVQVPANTTKQQMASYAADIKTAYPSSEITAVIYYSGDVNDPATEVGSFVGGRAALKGEGLNPPGT